MSNSQQTKERVVVYVDGFNMYFGLREAGFDRYRWLDIYALAQKLLKPHQELVSVKYFTSRVSNNPDKQRRQTTYIEALMEQGVTIFYGQYQRDSIECQRCGNIWPKFNEKMTDVNIATHLLVDAYQDSYDMAMLISGDSDLVPPIRAIHDNFPKKRVFVAFPPKRFTKSVSLIAKGSMQIGRKSLADCQLPDEVHKKSGYVLRKPKEWVEE